MSTPASPAGPRLNLRGAVDLSSLARRTPPAGAPAPSRPSTPGDGAGAPEPDGGPRVVLDVTDEEFGSLVSLSAQVPVVVDLWATWCGPCKQLSPILERLAAEYAGAFLLAKVDVDANPQISGAFQVQSIPSVVAIVKGQPVPLFQGAYPEAQVRQVLDELLRMAEANGVTGRVPGGDPSDVVDDDSPVEPELPPLHAEAEEALARDDLDAATDAYTRALVESPADADARRGLATVGILRRTSGVDPTAARADAAEDPSDIDAQILVADLDVLGGHVEDAFARLVDAVRVIGGDDRERVRAHLLELFDVVGGDDPRVLTGRRSLAAALF